MARTTGHPPASRRVGLDNRRRQCAACGGQAPADYRARRNVVTLNGVVALKVQVRVCHREGCPLRQKAIRAEEEGLWVLPEHEFGLDVIALIGALRHQEKRSVPAIHAALRARDVPISERSVSNLLERYDALLAPRALDPARLQAVTRRLGRVVLALSGLIPEAGNAVLWVARDCLSSEVLAAWSLPEHRAGELVEQLQALVRALDVPIVGVVSDGQDPVVRAVTAALPDVPPPAAALPRPVSMPPCPPSTGDTACEPEPGASEDLSRSSEAPGPPGRGRCAPLCMAFGLGRTLLPELLEFGASWAAPGP
ncbi:hypothetical protein [Corallococcus sp. 4LFB]|uniref:hypothetical protein n=1 Tax=Corallococcus sp. 4LFB TaxID=3383249 RepID=UPI0039748E41